MLKLKPTFLKENGQEKFVVLSINDYAAIREALEDAEDARILDEAIRRNAGKPTIPFEQVKRELGITSPVRKKKPRKPLARRVSAA
jgi:PHD/YefM family antitoxin component YafN of YafNO toxin-antitoxin module